jgi:hypothetical protein
VLFDAIVNANNKGNAYLFLARNNLILLVIEVIQFDASSLILSLTLSSAWEINGLQT